MCAFLTSHYIEEAKLCINSIRTYGCFQGPIYLFTDKDVKIPSVNVIHVPCSSVEESAVIRTRVFEYMKYTSDDIFLYMDTDILCIKPIPSFDTLDEKIHVYGYPNKTQKEESFCGFLTNDERYISKPSISSGILLFRPSEKVKQVFDETYKMYTQLILDKKINGCWEQPALCYQLITYDMYSITLNEYVYEPRTRKNHTEDTLFVHFCGLRSVRRFQQMKSYTDIYMKNKKPVINSSVSNYTISPFSMTNKSHKWPYGRIDTL